MIAELHEINENQLEFVYQNGIKTLEATLDGMKAISNRSVILLSYIGLTIGFCINRIFQSDTSWLCHLLIFIFMFYYICIFTYVISFAKPRMADIPYDDPNTLLNKECIGKDEYALKYTICFVLQSKIDENRLILDEMNAKFNQSINFAFLFIPNLFFKFCRYIVKLT